MVSIVGSKTGSKNSVLAFLKCMYTSEFAFLKCMDGSILRRSDFGVPTQNFSGK